MIFVLNVLSYLFEGFVFMKLWNWFPAVAFGIPTLNYVYALGVIIVLFFFKSKHIPLPRQIEELRNLSKVKRAGRVMVPIVAYAILLLLGWIVQLFV